jgi:hypothetical protein
MKIEILLAASISAVLALAQGGVSEGSCDCGHMSECGGALHPGDGVCCNGVRRQVLYIASI